jgi:hypothetical protein
MLKYNTLKATSPKHFNQKIINGLNTLLIPLFYLKRDNILVPPISKSRFLVSQFQKLLQFWYKLRLLTQKIVTFIPNFEIEECIQKIITFETKIHHF